jgi:hypothetical protein
MNNIPDWLGVALDPAHTIAELIWTIVFDGFVVAFLYGVVWKRVLLPKLKNDLHAEYDKEHGIKHKKKEKK